MPVIDDLTDLERRGWEALATEGEAPRYYDEVLDAEPLIVMPGGMVIDDRRTVIASMGGAPWQSYDLEEMRVQQLTADAAVVTYGGTASRDGSQQYSALFTSVFVNRDGEWKLALHQQTPR